MAIKQLTIRGFDKDLEKKIRQVARAERLSLNRAVILLLRRGAGLEAASQDGGGGEGRIGDGLDSFMGTWSEGQARQFDRAVAELRTIDDERWRP